MLTMATTTIVLCMAPADARVPSGPTARMPTMHGGSRPCTQTGSNLVERSTILGAVQASGAVTRGLQAPRGQAIAGIVLALIGSVLSVLSVSDVVAPATILAGGAVYALLSGWRRPRRSKVRGASELTGGVLARFFANEIRSRPAARSHISQTPLDLHWAGSLPSHQQDRQRSSQYCQPMQCA